MKFQLGAFVIKKILEVSLALWSLVTLTFLFLRFLPGGPFDREFAPHPLVRAHLDQSWHRNESLFDQYVSYLKSLLSGDLGLSLVQPQQSVLQVISQGLGQTLILNLVALLIIYFLAFAITFLWARSANLSLRTLIEQVLITLISLPSLFLAPLLIYVFGFYFNILPVALLQSPLHYILPVMALSLRPMAYLCRLLLRSISTQLEMDYARTAKAKGLSAGVVFYRHVLRNSLVPALSYSGTLIVSLFSGSFLIEMLFAIPGLGSEFISSLAERDYTVICGLTLFYGALLIILHLVLDFIMCVVDPRLREPT